MRTNENAPGLRAQDQGAEDHFADGSSTKVQGDGPARQRLASNPFGLSLPEVRAEARRCLAQGWQLWEVRERFAPGEGEAL